ncbi:baseplate J/gp47 family protein [Pectinatus frisingensis]|uniref:baseplate assembly protein n=1 Tax=Pectinatus frisingensis TaxID=865 RepID=UPI0018C51E9F|nr:baseplate J/gp47 family protein [Pectinatus frisingensis]
MELKQLPDITFAQSDPDVIETSVIEIYESLTGRTLAKADPVRLFLLSLAALIVQQRVIIDTAAKQNLLAYAKDEYLDHIGILVGTDRLQSAAATTTLQYTLSAKREQVTIIPAGKRSTPGNDVYFATNADLAIQAGELTGAISATCTQKGIVGNDFAIGEINKIVDNIPFVETVVNTTKSEGGSDTEINDAYRARIHEAPEKFSTAGPDGAYEYHTKEVSTLISDVSVDSPAPGEVVVTALLSDGKSPGQELLDAITTALNDRRVRPLTDKVTVSPPEEVKYNITVKYWIDRDDSTNAVAIQAAVNAAVAEYAAWQKTKLGRDINPTELAYRIRAAGAKRAEITEPIYTAIKKAQVAISDSVAVSFGGLEDG